MQTENVHIVANKINLDKKKKQEIPVSFSIIEESPSD